MNLCEVMKEMVAESGKSHRELASELGRSSTYVSVAMTNVCNGKDVGVERFLAIADACGYDVVVVSRSTGESVTLG